MAIGLAFIPMVFPVVMISFVIAKMSDIIGPVMEMIPKLIRVILSIFNPRKFMDDIIFGISYGISSLMSGIFSSINSGTSESKSKRFGDDTSKIPKVCVSPTIFNLVLLLICPPLALFMDRGIQGMFLVIVCAILTVKLYYFPGLIFAALHILC
jgi:uncharacterized membrane protein YqaE (UPF0057 family)